MEDTALRANAHRGKLEELKNLLSSRELDELNAIDNDFKASRDIAAKNERAVRYCEEISREGRLLDVKASIIYHLINFHCGPEALVFASEAGGDLKKRVKAWEKRPPCLQKLYNHWGKDVVEHCGLMDASYETLRHASSACMRNEDWDKDACPKLNWISLCLGQKEKLGTQHFKHLAKWVGHGDYTVGDQIARYGPLPEGHRYDRYGLRIPEPFGHSQRPCGAPSPVPSKSTQHVVNTPHGSCQTLEQSSSELIEAGSSQQQTRTASQDSPVPSGPLESSCRPSEQSSSELLNVDFDHRQTVRMPCLRARQPRDQTNVTESLPSANLANTGKAMTSKKRKRSIGSQSGRNKRQTRSCQSTSVGQARNRDPESWIKFEWSPLTFADDCVTNVLLDPVCESAKYGPSFQPIASVDIQPQTEITGTIASWIIATRQVEGLDSPRSDRFHDHVDLYLDALSPDCAFTFRTRRYAQQRKEEWCIVASKRIERGSDVKHLSGTRVTLPDNTEEPPNKLGRITWPDGTEDVVIGPVRFLGHACKRTHNAELVKCEDTIVVTALRSIGEDEEITISYGEHFFNGGDLVCACTTCCRQAHDACQDWQPRYWPPHDKGHEPASHATDQHLQVRDHTHETPVQFVLNLAINSAEIRTAALTSLDRQRKIDDTFQAHDATQLHYLLSLSREPKTMGWEGDLAGECELIVMDRTQLRSIPSKPAVVRNYGIPDPRLRTMETFARALLKALGSTIETHRKSLDVQLKSAKNKKQGQKGISSLRRWTIEEFVKHMTSSPLTSTHIVNVLDIGASFLSNADSWRPEALCRDDLLTEIRGRLQQSGKRGQAFEMKQTWFLAADPGANSILHIDSHGFWTFLLDLVESVIIVFCTMGDERGKEKIHEYMRIWDSSPPDTNTIVSSTMKEQLRWVRLEPGQLWVMPASTPHAVIRGARTLIFGGHFIPMRMLPEWLTSVEDSLRHYDSTNEDPAQLLTYISHACDAVAQRQEMQEVEELGGTEQVEKFWLKLTSLLRTPATELFDTFYSANVVRKRWNKWSKEMSETWKHRLNSGDV
jgi:hypothetical protein